MPDWKAITLPITLLAIACSIGCSSRNTNVYRSTIHTPRSIAVIEQATNEVVWDYDVPVGYKLIVNLKPNNSDSPTSLSYRLVSLEKRDLFEGDVIPGGDEDSGTIELAGVPVILKPSIRPGMEMPGSMPPATLDNDDIVIIEEAPAEAPEAPEAPAVEEGADEAGEAAEQAAAESEAVAETIEAEAEAAESEMK